MTQTNIDDLIARVISELKAQEGQPVQSAAPSAPAAQTVRQASPATVSTTGSDELVIDLPDPTEEFIRTHIGVSHPIDRAALENLRRTTSARLAVGNAGPRPPTWALLLFQADHAVTQDAIYGTVNQELLDKHGLFTVHSNADDRETYLLRPDLGRKLSPEAKAEIEKRCVKNPDVQIFVGDGLSAAAIENNLSDILPVIEQGLKSAGLTVGTPFFVDNARVRLMNDVNDIIGAKVVLMLIGERPGLGIADAMSAYMGYECGTGKTDADQDLLCMITRHGGTNPLEAGAYVVEMLQKMLKYKASGVKLRAIAGEDD